MADRAVEFLRQREPTTTVARLWEIAKAGWARALPYIACTVIGLEAAMFPSQYDLRPRRRKNPPDREAALNWRGILFTAARGIVPRRPRRARAQHPPRTRKCATGWLTIQSRGPDAGAPGPSAHYSWRAGPICGARTGFAMPKKTVTPWPPHRVDNASLALL